jgi:hypothetical protein
LSKTNLRTEALRLDIEQKGSPDIEKLRTKIQKESIEEIRSLDIMKSAAEQPESVNTFDASLAVFIQRICIP